MKWIQRALPFHGWATQEDAKDGLLIGQMSPTGATGWQLYIRSTETLYFGIGDGTNHLGVGAVEPSYTIGTMFHFMVRWNPLTNIANWRINNVDQGSLDMTSAPFQQADGINLMMGHYPTSGLSDDTPKLHLDHIGVWNVCLTDAQCDLVYTATAAGNAFSYPF